MRQRLLGQGFGERVVHHPGAFAASCAVRGLERRIVKRRVALHIVARPTGGAFNDVQIGQTQRGQLARHVLKQGLRMRVGRVVGGGHG